MPSKPSSSPSQNEPPGASADAGKTRLPFEPGQSRKKQSKQTAAASMPKTKQAKADNPASPTMTQRAFTGVPEDVSRRMARRMAYFCGVPTGLGMLTFVVSYFVVTQSHVKLPTVAVLLVSLGFFGLGVLGLSYGTFSASWDEGRVGSWLGWSEFRTNVGRAIASWKEVREKAL